MTELTAPQHQGAADYALVMRKRVLRGEEPDGPGSPAVLRDMTNDLEVAMKYVLLGNLSAEWASKQSERTGKAKAKLDKLGIKIESIHYTQGYYDFVDIVDAPTPEAMLAFSVWYSTQGLGRIQSMPAFDAARFEAAIKDAAG